MGIGGFGSGWLSRTPPSKNCGSSEEYRDAGDRVLILCHLYARGSESGVELDFPLAWLCTLRGGKIVRQHGYFSPHEALEAARLSE